MIKLKVDLDNIGNGIVILWLDGEFQTIFHSNNIESCISKAREIQKVMPIHKMEITKEAVEKSFKEFTVI